jgi:hypothetical protein
MNKIYFQWFNIKVNADRYFTTYLETVPEGFVRIDKNTSFDDYMTYEDEDEFNLTWADDKTNFRLELIYE